MDAQIRTLTYPNGEIQRLQICRAETWEELHFWQPKPSDRALDSFTRIYRKFLVPACPALFGTMVLFRLPEDMEVPFSHATGKYGQVADPLTAAAAALEEGLVFAGKKPCFRSRSLERFYGELVQRDCLRIVRGWLPVTTIIPVGNLSGFMSEQAASARMKVNSSFFIMDRFDCATALDHLGRDFGLRVKDGAVENPPAYGREALLVRKDGRIRVETADVRQLEIDIGGIRYRHGENAVIYDRPRHIRSPRRKGLHIAIVGDRVAAVKYRKGMPVPASGFVLCPQGDCRVAPGDKVAYHGLEDVAFGIQVGNSILKEGVKTRTFYSRFYNIRHLEPVPYPPSLYPMNFRRGRAARIALGADSQGRPMLIWAEGAGKLRYVPGEDSCGASLWEMADICADAGMVTAVNLDGGGSAQILLANRRHLQISDRREEDNSPCERPVPQGLIIP